ncbi:MAG: bifunctional 5,10-methylenetetrahydrofolate dehydrogenase/5,10-methenyltetrahydrofolate cyclohydrolase [bacterium]
MLTTTRLDGKSTANSILDNLSERVQQLESTPNLHVVLVGKDEASLSYIRQKTKSADRVGIESEVHTLPEESTVEQVRDTIRELNQDASVDGIIVQLPLPSHLEERVILDTVDPSVDVDGLHSMNFGRLLSGEAPRFCPPTPKGILHLLDEYNVEFKGKRVSLVGMGRLVGRPLSQMLLNRDATVLCMHEHTQSIARYTRESEIVIVAAGEPKLLTKEHISEGTVVVDAGIHDTGDGLVGDVDYEDVSGVAGMITPVPGGVGPLTVACLLSNTVDSCDRDA